MVRLLNHVVFQPSPEQPLDFELTIESYLLDLKRKFQLRQVRYDPYQMAVVRQRLAKQGVPVEEFPQSSPNLTAASQNLFDLIQSQALVLYPDDAMRLAVSRAVAIEDAARLAHWQGQKCVQDRRHSGAGDGRSRRRAGARANRTSTKPGAG